MKKVLTASAIIASTLVGYQAKKIDILEPKSRYVVTSDKPLSMIVGIETKKSGPESRHTVLNLSEAEAKRFRAQMPDGAILSKDRIYTTQAGCSPIEQPSDPLPDGPPLPDFPGAPGAPGGSEVSPWGFVRVGAEKLVRGQRGENVTVCVVDTGIEYNHPDLRDIIAGGKSYVGSDYRDDNGHGTHVAGTIAAQVNQIGVKGVSGAKIYAVKALGSDGAGWSSDIADGIDQCVRASSQVINLSLGSPRSAGEDPVIARAVRRAINAGVIVVAAAGNDSGPVGFPAASSGVVAVSASTRIDRIADFSSRGLEIDYIAPGEDIYSTCVGGRYCSMSGTSMAAPHVAALMALKLSGVKLGLNNIGLSKSEQGQGLLVVK